MYQKSYKYVTKDFVLKTLGEELEACQKTCKGMQVRVEELNGGSIWKRLRFLMVGHL